MSKHTPGPWYAGTKSVTASETENRLGLDVRIFGGNRDDNKANARLIAAAPRLLACLKNNREQLVTLRNVLQYTADIHLKNIIERIIESDEVIAKAEGTNE